MVRMLVGEAIHVKKAGVGAYGFRTGDRTKTVMAMVSLRR
jgi:hypothetical protein